MAVDRPAQPSTSGLATTSDESRGGFFTDTNGVGIDLSGIRGDSGEVGPIGPEGPPGPDGPTGPAGPSPLIIAQEQDLPPGSQPTVTITGSGVLNDEYIFCLLYTSPSPRDS